MPSGKGGSRRQYFTFKAQEKRKMSKVCAPVTFVFKEKRKYFVFPLRESYTMQERKSEGSQDCLLLILRARRCSWIRCSLKLKYSSRAQSLSTFGQPLTNESPKGKKKVLPQCRSLEKILFLENKTFKTVKQNTQQRSWNRDIK